MVAIYCSSVHLVKLNPDFDLDERVMMYLCQEITDRNSWRYSYARTVRLDELEVFMPVLDNGKIDFEAIKEIIENQVANLNL